MVCMIPQLFYRDESRVAPHNCYTNSEKLKEGIAAAGYSTEYLVRNLRRLHSM